jgi:drug/metabolite transporter (DMT)-like permease
VLLYFLAIAHLPVGTATLYNYTAPIFTTTFAAIFLNELLPLANVLAMLLACLGVGLVVYGQGHALGGEYFWQGLGLTSAVVSGAAITAIRAARRTDGAWEVLGAFCLVGMMCTAPFALHAWKNPTPALWLLLLVVGLLAAAAQILMTHALAAVEAATAGIVSQLTVVTALLLGSILDGEPFSRVSIVGAVLTLAGVSVVSLVSGARRAIAR